MYISNVSATAQVQVIVWIDFDEDINVLITERPVA